MNLLFFLQTRDMNHDVSVHFVLWVVRLFLNLAKHRITFDPVRVCFVSATRSSCRASSPVGYRPPVRPAGLEVRGDGEGVRCEPVSRCLFTYSNCCHEHPGSTPEDEAAEVTFMEPQKEIRMVPDMGKWKRSQAYADYMGFVLTLNEALKGKKLGCEYKVSETVEKLLDLLETLDRWINETPPVDQPSRFGNKAYRTWYGKLDQVMKLRSLRSSAASVRYLTVMRKLQRTYRMEPAGSQGVWGLDDFQFLPFIWGSSQFVDHPTLEPRHFIDERVVNEHHHDYMFLDCIKFINEMKTGPFAEHSNQLWNISAVPSWSKVNQGLVRMYKAELHFFFLSFPSKHLGFVNVPEADGACEQSDVEFLLPRPRFSTVTQRVVHIASSFPLRPQPTASYYGLRQLLQESEELEERNRLQQQRWM
ncbi:hypothetical protein F2P81_016465 [Scophthalmus maximus]|uniref:Serine/threonine-protein phosphatase 2A activator n=1 Tax=Scophthalmus maximus TaxID=52904 RepID=A0A6A4SJ49_SCOMX|nr:hypothetical protein F2P81_016465 [Scophthalmus maximus]